MDKKKKRLQIRNNSNFSDFVHSGEKFTLKSTAVPNDSYTIKELFDKHLKGQAMPAIGKQATYSSSDEKGNISHDSFDYNELHNADLVDQLEHLDKLNEVIEKGKVFEKKRADKLAAEKAAELEELNAIKAEYKQRKDKKKNVDAGKGGTTDDN